MADIFALLSDKAEFCKLVKTHFSTAPQVIDAVMRCEHEVSDERIAFAYSEYMQALKKFEVYLHSANPDHYKRAGALLHSLNSAKIVTAVHLESTSEDLQSGFTRVRAGDAEHVLPFVGFYENLHNQALAFDLAYQCCAAYEDEPRLYNFDYLHNVCRYLHMEPRLSVDSCFMLLKSLMQ